MNDRLAAALADRYRLERELGRGGMAIVYLAHDLRHDRKVAIKVLRPQVTVELGAERFLREITTTANLHHPHILALHESGEADGFLYYVMPFVDGESLRDRLDREKQLPLDSALQIAREVADALGHAHERGIIHRDIKPENILLSDGHAMVADFGIARAVSMAGTERITQGGVAVGTPTYMSPEQAAGEIDLDSRSDVYGLGCVVYEMIGGQPPFSGATAAVLMRQHLTVPVSPVTNLRPGISHGIVTALNKALAKAPADRFASVREFAAALLGATPRSSAQVSVSSSRRSQLLMLGALALVVAVAWFLVRGRSTTVALDPNVIAVLPFRVGGPSTDYLRESMLDLLQARLSTGTGARTVEPRTLLAAWRRQVGNEKDDLSEDASRKLARQLGAGRVLLGSAIATPTELTLNGRLIQVSDGKVLAEEKSVGAPDSVAVLVNRLTAALLIRGAGEAADRQAGLAAAPLEALQDYLAGRTASRRGDYFGAMRLFRRAFAHDSTFVDAAFAMVATNAWIGNIFESSGWEVVPVVSRLRDRLGARDLALFLAMPTVGPNYPRPSTDAEIIAQGERATALAPDSPEHWLLLGQLLSHLGAAASQGDWAVRSAAALDRAIALDSSFALAIGERLYTAMEVHDTANIRRFSRLVEAKVAAGFADDTYLWAAARTLGDSAAAIRWRNRSTGLSRIDVMQKFVKMALHSAAFALPLSDAHLALDSLQRSATTPEERLGAGITRMALNFADGRVELGDVDAGTIRRAQWAATLVQQSLIEPGYRAMGAATIALEAAGKYPVSAAAGAPRWPPMEDCFGALYRVSGGDTIGVAASLRRLQSFAGGGGQLLGAEEWQHVDLRVCPLLLQVLLEGTPAPHAPRPALDRLDSLMHLGPRGFVGAADFAPVAFANFTIARMREAQGDLPGALAAIRRREVDYFPAYLWSLAAFLRQEGRLAARSGDTAGALRAYDQYLTLRTHPDPPFGAQRDSVLSERAALRAH